MSSKLQCPSKSSVSHYPTGLDVFEFFELLHTFLKIHEALRHKQHVLMFNAKVLLNGSDYKLESPKIIEN